MANTTTEKKNPTFGIPAQPRSSSPTPNNSIWFRGRPRSQRTKVLNEVDGYAGSFDALIEEDGEPVIIDFKTSKSIHEEYALQIAAYSAAFCTTYEIDSMPKGRVVRFRKDKIGFEERNIISVEESFKTFLHVKAVHDAIKNSGYIKEQKIKKEKTKDAARTTGNGESLNVGSYPGSNN